LVSGAPMVCQFNHYITILGPSSICSPARETACQYPEIALQVQWMSENRKFQDADSPCEQKEEDWWKFCPICGAKLVNHKCRFVCSDPRCNFFMSCSEFDL
jgi:hypothetical protein